MPPNRGLVSFSQDFPDHHDNWRAKVFSHEATVIGAEANAYVDSQKVVVSECGADQ
jgi:hypothetical protein